MFSRFFIEHPIFATVVSLVIVIAGGVSMFLLPVEQYPTITPVQVTVSATYPGADSQTVAESVAAPIEAQINGVDNMLYMTSTSSSNGQLQLTVYFSLNTDPDIAQVQVQNRVNLAAPQLPEAVTQLGVSVQKKSSSIMMFIAVYGKGDRYSANYIANYANVYVLDRIKRVPGAGQAQIMGVPDQAMRIWMNPDRMASLGITTSDIQQAVASQNQLFGAGQIGQEPTAGPVQLTFPVVTQRPFKEPAQYDNIILRASQDGSAIVRLKDVARSEVGLRQYIVDSKLNGAPATFIAVYQQPGSNGLQVSEAVRKAMEEMKSRFPEGIDYTISLDTNDFVRISIDEVKKTLLEAVLLVVLVVYLFLQNFRATVICTVAIFVALVGTFAGMIALGFSINLLTLFGLILAIGIVVDDAIVVVENVERNMSQFHLSPKEATIRAMGEVTSPVIATVLVMSSVFVSAGFLPGTTGQLYKQFAITIAISVTISGFVALTLTPAMCGVLLKHSKPPERGFFAKFNRWFASFTDAFGRAVLLVIRRMSVAFVLLAVMLYAIVHFFMVLPTSFVPNEDQGYVMSAIIMPDAASLNRTADVSHRVDAIFAKMPAVENRTEITGYSLLDGGFKTQRGDVFHDPEALRGTLRLDEDGERAERTGRSHAAPPGEPGHRQGAGHSHRTAGHPGHRDDRRLRVLDPGHRRRRAGRARFGDPAVPRESADPAGDQRAELHLPRLEPAAAGQRRPGQGHAAQCPGGGRLQRHPGPVRFRDREPVQRLQPCLVGRPAIRPEVPAEAR